jgi:ABC-type transport system involved in cytochrome bd biosynthesis fused ATPase/permease subunit
MGIFRAFGLGLFLLIVALLMPAVFAELTKTIVIFLQSSEQAFAAAGVVASYAGHIPPPVH